MPEADRADRPPERLRLAVLISGGGSTMFNLADHVDRGELDAEIVLVLASNPKAGGIERARQRGFDVDVVDRKRHETPESFGLAVWPKVRAAGAELVVLAGFLSLLPIPEDFEHRVVNIHPALLPKFGGRGMFGRHVHAAVLDAGERESGCTVHFADNEYDHGPVILQRRCPVEPGDTPETLAARVQEAERRALPEAIQRIAAGRVRVDGERVTILPPPP